MGNKITFKSATKAQVQYGYVSESKVSKDQQNQIVLEVNKMLTANTKVSCSPRDDNECALPNGIDGESQLYDIVMDGNNNYLAVSHIPISMNHLDALSEFKIIKFNHKTNKNAL